MAEAPPAAVRPGVGVLIATAGGIGFLRPAPGWAQYRTPIKNLYLCGSATHPGGGIMGANGLNAAQTILSDWKRRKI